MSLAWRRVIQEPNVQWMRGSLQFPDQDPITDLLVELTCCPLNEPLVATAMLHLGYPMGIAVLIWAASSNSPAILGSKSLRFVASSEASIREVACPSHSWLDR